MTINHVTAIKLEHLVCEICECERFGICGIASASNFEVRPIEAAILCFAKLSQYPHKSKECTVKAENFLDKWHTIFEYPKEHPRHTCEEYLSELEQAVKCFNQH